MRRWIVASALCAAGDLGAQEPPAPAAVLQGKVVDSAGAGVPAQVVVRSSPDPASDIGRGASAADGTFRVALRQLPARVWVEALVRSGLAVRITIDSLAVRASANGRPVVLRLGRPPRLADVRARYQRRPSVFAFFETEASTRTESVGIGTTDWLDPLAVGQADALLRASPDLLVTAGGGSSVLGAPESSNQVQIGGVRVPGELVTGQLNGYLTTSPWDVTVGGAAGATVNLFLAPAGRYQSSYAVGRSGVGGVPRWVQSPGGAPGVNVPAQLSVGTTGPIGTLGYRAQLFAATDATSLPRWDETLDARQRGVLDSLSGVLDAPTVRNTERSVQAGVLTRLDLVPSSNGRRILALTSALTRVTRHGGTLGGYRTGSAGTDGTHDVAFLQLESTNVLRERVLWTSFVSTSWNRQHLTPVTFAPTVITTDAGASSARGWGAPARGAQGSPAGSSARRSRAT